MTINLACLGGLGLVVLGLLDCCDFRFGFWWVWGFRGLLASFVGSGSVGFTCGLWGLLDLIVVFGGLVGLLEGSGTCWVYFWVMEGWWGLSGFGFLWVYWFLGFCVLVLARGAESLSTYLGFGV